MRSKVYFILSMILFGTIGVFVRNIDLASSQIALLRGFIGSLFLLVIILLRHQRISWENVKNNKYPLLLSSLALGCNWIFLFQAYKYTTLANAALSYYFAPVFLVMMSPVVLKEKISAKRAICIGVALFAMFLIVQGRGSDDLSYRHSLGIFYGIIAAAFYATLMLTNKFIKNMDGLETTFLQLSLATVLLAVYVFPAEGVAWLRLSEMSLVYIFILGVLHTGTGFYLFFTGMKKLKGQTIAALSYMDPVTSLFVSFFVLGEIMTVFQILGAVLLLGATFISEKK